MLTLNGPCSSFILMMRPMCGSSSATRMWQRCVAGPVTLDQGSDVAAIAAHIKEKPTQVGRWAQQNQQQRVVSKRSDDRVSLLVFQNRRVQRTLNCRATETLRFRNERWNASGEIFVVESRRGKAFNQESVLSEHENGVNSGSLTERGCKVSDVGHLRVRSCEARKQQE